MDEYDKKYMSEYDIEIERREEELKEIYRKDGESRYIIFVESGGIIVPIVIIPLFIWMITKEAVRIYGIAGVLLCIVVGILAVVGRRYHNNRIDRLEREIIELKEKKKQEEQKYAQYQNNSIDSSR